MENIVYTSTIECPDCKFKSKEEMPSDSCLFFHECKNCGTVLKPRQGDCCVFCSYGEVKCPPIQANNNCCN